MTREISERIGQRITEAANLAVAMHLESGVMNERHLNQGQHRMTGGAGFDASRDGALSIKDARHGSNSHERSSILAERMAS
jgi:hypothetical protein